MGPCSRCTPGHSGGRARDDPPRGARGWGRALPARQESRSPAPRGRAPHRPTTDGGPDAGDSGVPADPDPCGQGCLPWEKALRGSQGDNSRGRQLASAAGAYGSRRRQQAGRVPAERAQVCGRRWGRGRRPAGAVRAPLPGRLGIGCALRASSPVLLRHALRRGRVRGPGPLELHSRSQERFGFGSRRFLPAQRCRGSSTWCPPCSVLWCASPGSPCTGGQERFPGGCSRVGTARSPCFGRAALSCLLLTPAVRARDRGIWFPAPRLGGRRQGFPLEGSVVRGQSPGSQESACSEVPWMASVLHPPGDICLQQ